MTRRNIGIIISALGSQGRRRLGLLGALTLAGAIAEYSTLLALMGLRLWMSTAEMRIDAGAAITFMAAVLAAGTCRLLIVVATQRLVLDAGHRLLVTVQRRLLAREWVAHARGRASERLAAIEQVDLVVCGLLRPWLQGAAALFLGGAILTALLTIDAPAALAAAVLLGLLFVLSVSLFRPMLKRAGRHVSEGYQARIETLQDHEGAMRELILG